MKIFVSCSFDKKDALVVSEIIQLIQVMYKGAEMVSAKKPLAESIIKKVNDAINQADAAIFILTAREKLESGGHTVSPWCLAEIGIIAGKNIPFCIFHEEELVDPAKLGFPSAFQESCPFSRDSLNIEKLGAYIDSAFSNVIFAAKGQYQISMYDSHTVIYNSGHGISVTTVEVHALEKTTEIAHQIGVYGGPSSTIFPKGGMATMLKTPAESRFTQNTFTLEVLSSSVDKLNAKIIPIEERSSEQSICFIVKFNKPLGKGDCAVYQYGWSLVEMHYANKEQCEGDGRKSCESKWTATHPSCKFTKTLSFEKGYPLARNPLLTICDFAGKEKERKEFEQVPNVYYNRFQITLSPITRNAEHVATWSLKKGKGKEE